MVEVGSREVGSRNGKNLYNVTIALSKKKKNYGPISNPEINYQF